MQILEPSCSSAVPDIELAMEESLVKPTSGPSLGTIIKKIRPSDVVIIVNDLTRSTPTSDMIRPVLRYLEKSGIRKDKISVVATGTHRAMTEDEQRIILGDDIVSDYSVSNHDCDAPDLVTMGTLTPEMFSGSTGKWQKPT